MKLIGLFTSAANRTGKRLVAFTIIELLVVMGVIALLVAVLLPALASTTQGTLRTQCLYNLRQLGVGTTVYANDNNGIFVPAKPTSNGPPPYSPPFVQYALFSYFTNGLQAAGIPLVSNAPSVWGCPDIPGLPCPDSEDFPQWIIGYQYFGGITEWSPMGSTSSALPGTHSPVKLTQSKPYWCLAADLVAKINGTWGGAPSLITDPTLNAAYKYIPPHREGTNAVPTGGNEVFVDGSANWCRVETMHQFTTWNADVEMWFYQSTADISGFGPTIELNAIKWTGN